MDKILAIDCSQLADSLSGRFRLSLSGSAASTAKGVGVAVRPADLSPPNGFMLLITPGWKSIDAEFVPDNYAGSLIRAMGNSGPRARELFSSLADVFVKKGYRIDLSINGSVTLPTAPLPVHPWARFEINVHRLTSALDDGDTAQLTSATDIAGVCLSLLLTLLPLEEDEGATPALYEARLPEGACTKVVVNKYERSPANRAACIAVHGSVCKVCGFDFGKFYGQFGQGYIEVHHRIPIAKMSGNYVVNPVTDLVPLCSNCHSVVHRHNPPVDPEVLAGVIKEK
ncbi:MAG: HNH endonuclease [Gammaproteobacteria bacterium]|nr:HNH endonuclease [Gammaproteobacteria bacterium]